MSADKPEDSTDRSLKYMTFDGTTLKVECNDGTKFDWEIEGWSFSDRRSVLKEKDPDGTTLWMRPGKNRYVTLQFKVKQNPADLVGSVG
jgi:hypothetical protein